LDILVGSEFTIEKPLMPKRHLINFSWNNKVISAVNQFGTGEGVFNNQTLSNLSTNKQNAVVRSSKQNSLAIGEITNPQRLHSLYKKKGYNVFTLYRTNTMYIYADRIRSNSFTSNVR
jgi:hypothetical protein